MLSASLIVDTFRFQLIFADFISLTTPGSRFTERAEWDPLEQSRISLSKTFQHPLSSKDNFRFPTLVDRRHQPRRRKGKAIFYACSIRFLCRCSGTSVEEMETKERILEGIVYIREALLKTNFVCRQWMFDWECVSERDIRNSFSSALETPPPKVNTLPCGKFSDIPTAFVNNAEFGMREI